MIPTSVCSILESLPTGVCLVDMQKRILLWSDGAERITVHLRYEAIGRSCSAEPLLHCNQPGCEFCNDECPLARAMKTSHGAESNGVLHHKSRYEVPVGALAVQGM
jgi:PAS domain-containing protein